MFGVAFCLWKSGIKKALTSSLANSHLHTEYEGRLPNAQAEVTLPGLAPNGPVGFLGERLTPHPFPWPQRSHMDISLLQMCDREACRGEEAVDAGISKATRLWSSHGSLHCRLIFSSHSSSPCDSIPRRLGKNLLPFPEMRMAV